MLDMNLATLIKDYFDKKGYTVHLDDVRKMQEIPYTDYESKEYGIARVYGGTYSKYCNVALVGVRNNQVLKDEVITM